jgi:DNA-binding Lrp family transcriptional regulator
MTKKVFLLINTSVNEGEKSYVPKARKIARLVGMLDAVRSCYVAAGAYQVIVEVEAPDLNEVGKIITDRIAGIPGVDRYTTCIVLGEAPEERSGELTISGKSRV